MFLIPKGGEKIIKNEEVSDNQSLQNDFDAEDKTSQTADLLFFVGFAIWSIFNFIGFSELHNILPGVYLSLFRFGGLAIVFSSFLLRKFLTVSASKFFLLTLSLAFLIFNNGYLAGDTSWFDTGLLILCSLGLNYGVFFFRAAVYRLLLNGSLIFLAILNVIPNRLANMSVTRIRFNLGYNWASYAAHTFLFIVLLFVWYYRKSAKPWLILILALINWWIFAKTDTKGPYLIVILILSFWFITSFFDVEHVESRTIYISTIVALPLLSFLIIFFSAHSQDFVSLNNILSNRLQLGDFYIKEYGFSWFGHPIFEFTDQTSTIVAYQTIDSSLLKYLVKYGTFSSIIFLIIWFFVSKRIADLKNIYLDLVVIILAIEAFSDPWFLVPSYNIFLILVGILFQGKITSSLES